MASSRQFLNQITGRFPKSDPEDMITMMNALALVWAEAKNQSETGGVSKEKAAATKRDYRFAARVFCVLQDPLQPASLQGQIAFLAQTYRGVAKDPKVHAKFRQSISIGLLTMCKDADAVLSELAKTGVGGLFRL
jgi:hypothetical protein